MRRMIVLVMGLTALVVAATQSAGQITAGPVAQPQDIGLFYFVTYNQTAQNETVWEADAAEGRSRRVLTLDSILRQTPRAVFPERELDLLESVIANGAFYPDQADIPAIAQDIQGVWLLDTNRLLMLTTNDISDFYAGYTFGYFEFLMVNIQSGTTTSLMKVEYHPAFLESWGCDSTFTTVFMNQVAPNPILEKFVFVLKVHNQWCAPHLGQSYLVDYSVIPVSVVELSSTSQVSWSPDGTLLAYTAHDLCVESSVCNTSYNLLAMSPGAVPTSIAQHQTFKQWPTLSSWVDSQRVLFQFGEPTDAPLNFAWYDLHDNQTTSSELQVDGGFTSVFYLQDDQVYLLIGLRSLTQELTLMRFTHELEIVETLPIDQLFYSSRFPRYLFMRLDNNITQILDASLNFSTFDLSAFISADPSETVYYLAPGPSITLPASP